MLATLKDQAMITVTSVEAQNKFGQLLDTAQREPVIITRHGRPAAYMISPQDMKEFQEARARSDQGKPARDWATASAQAWNEFDAKFGSFADEHSTL
jgi:prevent-host-death family protein